MLMADVLTRAVFGKKLNLTMTLDSALEMLRMQNLINYGELTEQAVSIKSKIERCPRNTPNIDLISGKQIKYASVSKGAKSASYIASIGRKTTAPILCVVDNPVTNKKYYFHFPYEAHSHLKGANIKINFGTNGIEPTDNDWMKYRVESFEKLCELAK